MCSHRCASLLILCVALVPVCASGASFTVDQISDAGPEMVSPGDIIQVSARISFDAAGEVTFPGQDMLQFSTSLETPLWQYALFVDNNPVQTFSRESGVVFINGYYLEYAQGRSEYLSVEVTGTIPEGVDGEQIDVLTVTQYDEYGNVRGGGVTTIPIVLHVKDESFSPEPTQIPNATNLPESTSPTPTQSPLSGFVCVMGMVCALAVIGGKK